MKKKALISPLCSALVVPGLGQILNEQIKKGICLLTAVLGLLVVSGLFAYRALENVFQNTHIMSSDSSGITGNAGELDLTRVWYLLLLFGVLWLYAVVDAFIYGRAADKRASKENG